MADWKLLIDSVEKDIPKDWRDVEITIERDDLTNGLLRTFTSEATFTGTAYTALKTIRDADITDSAAIDLQYKCKPSDAFSTLFEGTVFVSDLTVDHWRCNASGQIEDQHYTAKISNNRKIKKVIGVNRSKRDTSFTAITTRAIDMFVPSSGTYIGAISDIEMYTVSDAFEDLIKFMTDDTVGFTNNVTELDTLCVFRGEALNNSGLTGYAPYISFDQLFTEVNKKYNVGFYIDTSGATPIFTLDTLANVFDATNAVTFDNVRELKETIDNSLIYSKVQVGSNNHNKSTDAFPAYQWPDIRFFNHANEEYHLDIECNSDNILDLVSDFIISSNTIEEMIVAITGGGSVTTYDDDHFFVETDIGVSDQATKYDNFNIGAGSQFNYNNGLTNQEVIPRFSGVISADLKLFLGDGNDTAKAFNTKTYSSTAGILTLGPMEYDDDCASIFPGGNDANSNWNGGNGTSGFVNCGGGNLFRYIAPADGWYRFKCLTKVENVVVIPVENDSVDIRVRFRRYDNTHTLISTEYDQTTNITSDTDILSEPGGFYMDANDHFDIFVSGDGATIGPGPGLASFDFGDGGSVEVTEAATGGGTFASFDKNDTRIVFYETEIPIDQTDFATILSNPEQAVTINIPRTGTTKKGWIKEINFPVNGPKARLKIITTVNT